MSSETPALCASGLQRHSLNGQTMGTRYSAIFFAPVGVDQHETAKSVALQLKTQSRRPVHELPAG